MFKEWGFLLTEIWVLLALAALLGLFVGWLIWGHYKRVAKSLEAQLRDMQGDLRSCEANLKTCTSELEDSRSNNYVEPVPAVSLLEGDYDGDGVIEGADEGNRPEALTGPRNGVADDLKQIKGVGVKMENLCNTLGFYHFDQIAGWSKGEVAWVDANLVGFKGRVTRDKWVKQAKVLARGGKTAFSKKVAKGAVNY